MMRFSEGNKQPKKCPEQVPSPPEGPCGSAPTMWFKKSQRYRHIAYWFGQRSDGEACIQSTGILRHIW